jgi:hypothetical protein
MKAPEDNGDTHIFRNVKAPGSIIRGDGYAYKVRPVDFSHVPLGNVCDIFADNFHPVPILLQKCPDNDRSQVWIQALEIVSPVKAAGFYDFDIHVFL